MMKAPRLMLSGKLAALCLALMLAASCAKNPIPAAFQGLGDQEIAAALSDTTTLYQTEYRMKFEYFGPDGAYRRWSSKGGVYILSGTWSVSGGSICRHIPNKSQGRTDTYCEENSKKLKTMAAVFTGDTLKMANRRHSFCNIFYSTVPWAGGTRPNPDSTVLALTASAALRDHDNEEFARNNCNDYVHENKNNWYRKSQGDASKMLKEIRYSSDGIDLIDMAKFENLAPIHLTSEGIKVFRRYFNISNSVTKKAHRPNKFFVHQYF